MAKFKQMDNEEFAEALKSVGACDQAVVFVRRARKTPTQLWATLDKNFSSDWRYSIPQWRVWLLETLRYPMSKANRCFCWLWSFNVPDQRRTKACAKRCKHLPNPTFKDITIRLRAKAKDLA